MRNQRATPKASRESVVDAVLSASRVLVAVAARSLGDVAEEVTLTQYRTLVVLASRGPRAWPTLAEAVDVTPSTATRMCDRLVRKGAGRAPPRTGRPPADPTHPDRERAGTGRRRHRATPAEIAGLLRSIPRDQQAALVDALQRLATAAGEVPEQDWSTGWDL